MRRIRRFFEKLHHLSETAECGRDELAVSGGRRLGLMRNGSIRHVAFHRLSPQVVAAAEPVPAPPAPRRRDVSGGQIIVLAGLGLERGGRAVLSDIDLVLGEHRIAILGLNGSGKSSLLKLMVGLLAPTSGSLSLDGLDPCEAMATVRTRTGFLFQCADNQIVYPIVREDLAFGLEGGEADVDATIARALDRLGIADLADRRIHELSGGERQLVALAGVLARDPSTILFDEPTSQLDLANRNRFREVLAKLPQQAIVVTHDLDLVADFDRVLVVADGTIAFDGAPGAAVDFYRRRHG
jgi:biotin transport system ATP-binding protein